MSAKSLQNLSNIRGEASPESWSTPGTGPNLQHGAQPRRPKSSQEWSPAIAPGERRASESAPAFEAFALYRDLGPSRSIQAVARELNKSSSLIGRWSATHTWAMRVSEWDRYQDDRRRTAESAALDDMSHRHADAVQVQIQALMAPAKALLLRLEKDPTLLSELELSDLVQFVSKCARPLSLLLEAERKARGVESVSDEACCEHEVARRRLASATNAELIAIMTGSSIVH